MDRMLIAYDERAMMAGTANATVLTTGDEGQSVDAFAREVKKDFGRGGTGNRIRAARVFSTKRRATDSTIFRA